MQNESQLTRRKQHEEFFIVLCSSVKSVVLDENRKSFTFGFTPEDLDGKLHITNGIEQITCEAGYEDFFKMLELEANSHTDTTDKNLIGCPVKCNLIFSKGESFAITSLSTSNYLKNCFVLSKRKNYPLEEAKELAKRQMRQKLLSQIEMYNKDIQKLVAELYELEHISLSLEKSDIDKIRNQH